MKPSYSHERRAKLLGVAASVKLSPLEIVSFGSVPESTMLKRLEHVVEITKEVINKKGMQLGSN